MNFFIVIIFIVIVIIAIACFYISRSAPVKETFSTFESYQAIGNPGTVASQETLVGLGNGRGSLNWYLPLWQTTSRNVNNFYTSIPKNYGREEVTLKTVPDGTSSSVLYDIYPLSIRDTGGTINPYSSQGIADVVNSFSVSTPLVINRGKFRIEISKASPIMYSSGNATASLLRWYSNPNPGSDCVTGVAPSRWKPDFALLTPLISPNNVWFGKNRGSYSSDLGWTNLHGRAGGSLPARDYYYSTIGALMSGGQGSQGASTVLTSQTFEVDNPTGIIINTLLNPYVPEGITGDSIDARRKWYETYYRGRVRCSVQARFNSLTGSVGYVYNPSGDLVHVEPIRAFNFGQDLGVAISPGVKAEIEKDRQSRLARIAKAEAAIAASYKATEEGYRKFKAESDKNIQKEKSANYEKRKTEELAKQAKKRREETAKHAKQTAHEQKIISDEWDKHEQVKKDLISKGPNPLYTNNVQIGILNHSLPVIPMNSAIIPGYVRIRDTAAWNPTLGGLGGTQDGSLPGSIRSVNYVRGTLAEKLPIGGVEFFSRELEGKVFTDFTKRVYTIESSLFKFGTTIPKLTSYSHNYYFPWIREKKTKFVVIENCNAALKQFFVLGFALRAYTDWVMDPADIITEVRSDNISCFYPTDPTGSSATSSRVVNGYASLPKTPVPKQTSTLRENSTDLTNFRSGTGGNTIILTLKTPVFLHSITAVFRHNQHFRAGCNVSLYNEHTHAISTTVINDSYGIGESGPDGSVNGVYATFGPTTPLEPSSALPE